MSEDLPRTRPGRPYPLGATWDGGGVNFALFGEHATAVALCFYDARDPGKEIRQIRIEQRTGRCGTSTSRGSGPARSTPSG